MARAEEQNPQTGNADAQSMRERQIAKLAELQIKNAQSGKRQKDGTPDGLQHTRIQMEPLLLPARTKNPPKAQGQPGELPELIGVLPANLLVSDFMRKVKGRSSYKVQREFPHLKKHYWGGHFWGRGYFSTTNGAITEQTVLQYLEQHSDKSTGTSR